MQSINALREQINARAQEVRALVESNNDKWSAAHQEKYDAGMSEIESLKSQVARAESVLAAAADDKAVEAVAAAAASRAPTAAAGDRMAAIYDKWMRQGEKAVTAEEWRDVRATMSTTTGSEGGFSVQTEVASRLIDSLKAFGGMREAAQILRTAMGNDMSFPTSDGTSEVGELIAQNTTATAADPVFNTVGLPVYKYSSKIVAAPIELLQDSQLDIAAFVEGRLATRIARITNTHLTVGTGTAQPAGVVTRATTGVTGATGQATSITFDSLISMVHSVDPAYRTAPGVRWMMHDTSLRNVRLIKDGQQRPVFLPGYDGLNGSMGDSILGYAVTVNQDVPVMAANARSVLFGDFGKYVIRDVMDTQMFRFTDSAYTSKGQVGFLAWMRCGGNLLDTAAVKVFINSAT